MSNSKFAKGRPPKKHYLPVPNDLIRDKNVSDGTFRVICWINSHNDDFEITFAGLQTALSYGRDKLRAIVKNGIKTGYIIRQRLNDATTGLFDWIYAAFTSKEEAKEFAQSMVAHPSTENPPMDEQPCPENPATVCPAMVNQGMATYIDQENKEEENHCVRSARTHNTIFDFAENLQEEEATQVHSTTAPDKNTVALEKQNLRLDQCSAPPLQDPKMENLVTQLDRGELKDLPDNEKKQLANYLMGEQIKLYRRDGWILSVRPNDISTDFLKYVAWKELKQPDDLGWARNTVLAYERDMTKWGQLVALIQGWQTATPEEVSATAIARVASRRGSKEDLEIAIQSSIDAYKTITDNPFRRKKETA